MVSVLLGRSATVGPNWIPVQQCYPSNWHSASRLGPDLPEYPLRPSFMPALCAPRQDPPARWEETRRNSSSLDWLQDLWLYRYYTAACFLATSIEFHTLPLTVQAHEERERAKLASTLPMIVIKRSVFFSQACLLAIEKAGCTSTNFPPVQIRISAC